MALRPVGCFAESFQFDRVRRDPFGGKKFGQKIPALAVRAEAVDKQEGCPGVCRRPMAVKNV
jgi:hypothetical protein